MITGAIFDMDGILFDTERVYFETWQEMAMEYGVKLDKDFMRVVSGTTGKQKCEIVARFYSVEDGSDIVAACSKRVKERLEQEIVVKKGVYEILKRLKEMGMKTAVASSSALEQIEKNLRKTNTYDFFDAIVSGRQVPHGKPAPDVFLLAAQKIGCKPEECYVFEDSENGVRAGHTSGAVTIMIPDLVQPSEEIRALCDEICTDFFEVIDTVLEKKVDL